MCKFPEKEHKRQLWADKLATFLLAHLPFTPIPILQFSGVTGGGGQGLRGAECPQRLLTGKFLLIYREKRDKGKKRKMEKKGRKINWKKEGGKLKMEEEKVTKWAENHWNLFCVYQNGNFLPGKSISRREKIRKNDFAPSERFSSYAPAAVYLFI